MRAPLQIISYSDDDRNKKTKYLTLLNEGVDPIIPFTVIPTVDIYWEESNVYSIFNNNLIQ